jgi:hypothetical protein
MVKDSTIGRKPEKITGVSTGFLDLEPVVR